MTRQDERPLHAQVDAAALARGAGRWKLVVRMRCESGQDGLPIIVRRSNAIRIR